MKEDYVDLIVFDRSLPFYIDLAGISYYDGSFFVRRPQSTVSSIEYIISGTGTVKSNNNIFHPHAGDTYVLYAGDDHEYYSSKNDPWTKIWLTASGDMVSSLAEMYKVRKNTVFHCNTEPFIRRMHRELARRDIPPSEITDKTALIFHELMQFLHNHNNDQTNVSPEALQMKNHIDMHIYEPLVINELANQVYKSPAQAIRIFKKSYGCTPYDYYLNAKLEKAESMLRSTNFSIKEISYRLGFCDEHYFSGVFSRKIGQSPSKYRKQWNKLFLVSPDKNEP